MPDIDYAFYLQAITVSASFFLCVDLFMLSVLPRGKAMLKMLRHQTNIIDHCLSYSSFVNAALTAYLSMYILYKEGIDFNAPNSHMSITIMCVSTSYLVTTLLGVFVYELFHVRCHMKMFILLIIQAYSLATGMYGSLVVFAIALSQIGELFQELSKILEPNAGLGPLPSFLRFSFLVAYLYTQCAKKGCNFLDVRRVPGRAAGVPDPETPGVPCLYAHKSTSASSRCTRSSGTSAGGSRT